MKRLLRPGGGLLCVAIAILLTAVPAMAGLAPYWLGPESGHYGTHMLLDNGEYQGATCLYNSSHTLHKINIRRPIVFAFNRTSHTDTEWVGWRYVIEVNLGKVVTGNYTDWTNVAVGPIHKAKATDQANALLKPTSYTFPSAPPLGAYRVSIQMFWYLPSQTALDGKALDVVMNYRVVDPALGTGYSEYYCDSSSVI